MKRIGIVGYGYVGKSMGSLFHGKKDFEVVIHDPLRMYDNVMRINESDLAIVCVPTPMGPDNGSADISIVHDVVSWIKAPLILIKSTVPPGTTDDLMFLKGDKYAIAFSPEYIGEPSIPISHKYLDPFDSTHHGFMILGTFPGRHEAFFDIFQRVMPVDTKFVRTSARAAEIAKYMENAYFATKVTFCNEFARICAAFGEDYFEVRNLWLHDPRIEADHTAVFPEHPGYAGKCLPKDVSAIIAAARAKGVAVPFLMAMDNANAMSLRQGDK